MKNVLIMMPTTQEFRTIFKDAADGLDLNLIFKEEAEPTSEELASASMIVGNPPADSLKALDKLEFLQLTSAGTGAYCRSIGENTILANATGGYGLAIAEHMLALVLTIMKRIHEYRDNQKDGKWNDRGNVTSIYGSRTLVVGMGDIGGEFAKRMTALGSHVVGIRRTYGAPKPEYVEAVFTADELDRLLPGADIVALSMPETPDTIGLFDERRISLMKDGAILINVGRGSCIDTNALVRALDSGKLMGAGLDVTNPEPLPADHPLWKCQNALISPHISGGFHLEETERRICKLAAQNMHLHFAGTGTLLSVVDLSTGYRRI